MSVKQEAWMSNCPFPPERQLLRICCKSYTLTLQRRDRGPEWSNELLSHIGCQCSFGPSVQVSRLWVQCSGHHGFLAGPTVCQTPCSTWVICAIPESLFLFLSFPFSSPKSNKGLSSLPNGSAGLWAIHTKVRPYCIAPTPPSDRGGQAVNFHLSIDFFSALLLYIFLMVTLGFIYINTNININSDFFPVCFQDFLIIFGF